MCLRIDKSLPMCFTVFATLVFLSKLCTGRLADRILYVLLCVPTRLSSMQTRLLTGKNRLHFYMGKEPFAIYRMDTVVPGFDRLYAMGERALTLPSEELGVSLWVAHGDVNGVAFGLANAANPAGNMVSEELTARRGPQSVGFRQVCVWRAPDETPLVTETRTVRVLPGYGEGRILDLTLQLEAHDEDHVMLGRSEVGPLVLRVTNPLWPTGNGQLRNSAGSYGLEAIQGQSAVWCACLGVVDSETVGFALLDHPNNPGHPPPWRAERNGLLSPAPFTYRSAELPLHVGLTFRYRLLVHRGYVDQGWADARLAEFARELR